jgi:hypothetical protein
LKSRSAAAESQKKNHRTKLIADGFFGAKTAVATAVLYL